MKERKKNSSRMIIISIAACSFAALLIFGLYTMASNVKQGPAKQRAVQMVKLMTPPPPKPLEKPPEPEIKKEIPKEQTLDVPQQTPQKADEGPPPGKDLGLDAEGGAGSDAFGLVGRKGGRELIGGPGGDGDLGNSLMRKYGWYIHILEEEIGRQMVKKARLPNGGQQVFVKIVLDGEGGIVSHTIYGSSGDTRVDSAVNEALRTIKKVSEPPPDGMPRTLRIRITVPGRI